MKDDYLQDRNAGNLGDYLKHFCLIKLVTRLLKKYSEQPIAYIDTHAGAGVYGLLDTHWKHANDYKRRIYKDPTQWRTFDKLNPYIKNRLYFGSFALVGSLLFENRKTRSKIVLYENNLDTFDRIEFFEPAFFPNCHIELLAETSDPTRIRTKIKQLQKNFEIIVCFIDPYFKNGEKDKIWCQMLSYDKPGCYILMFDAARGRGKNDEGDIKFVWHCPKDPIRPYKGDKSGYRNDGIKGYAMFGNVLTEEILNDQ